MLQVLHRLERQFKAGMSNASDAHEAGSAQAVDNGEDLVHTGTSMCINMTTLRPGYDVAALECSVKTMQNFRGEYPHDVSHATFEEKTVNNGGPQGDSRMHV